MYAKILLWGGVSIIAFGIGLACVHYFSSPVKASAVHITGSAQFSK